MSTELYSKHETLIRSCLIDGPALSASLVLHCIDIGLAAQFHRLFASEDLIRGAIRHNHDQHTTIVIQRLKALESN